MSERLSPKNESYAETVQREFQNGLVIECETTVSGDNGMAKNLSYQKGTDLLVSSSLWRFRGPDSGQKAKTVAEVMNMYAEGRGPYVTQCVDGATNKEAPDGTITEESFSAVVVTGPTDQVTQEQVTDFSYAGVKKMNQLLTDNQLGFNLPLPKEVQQLQS